MANNFCRQSSEIEAAETSDDNLDSQNHDTPINVNNPAMADLPVSSDTSSSVAPFYHASDSLARASSPQESSSITQSHSDTTSLSTWAFGNLTKLFRGGQSDGRSTDHQDMNEGHNERELGEHCTELNTQPVDNSTLSEARVEAEAESEAETKVNEPSSRQDDDEDVQEFLCPICQELLNEVSVTECGHTYCYSCIMQHLRQSQSCPVCRTRLSPKSVFPNFQFNKMVNQYRERKTRAQETALVTTQIRTRKFGRPNYAAAVASVTKNLSCEDSTKIFISILRKKKQEQMNTQATKIALLETFLEHLRDKNQRSIDKMKEQIKIIDRDLEKIRSQRHAVDNDDGNNSKEQHRAELEDEGDNANETQLLTKRKFLETLESGVYPIVDSEFKKAKQQRMMSRFQDLEEQYFQKTQSDNNSLDSFTSMLYETTRYSKFRVVDTMFYTNMSASSSIVSSIEFDRDDEYFAVGGVTRDIKIYEFNMINSGDSDASDQDDFGVAGSSHSQSNYIGSSLRQHVAHCPIKVLDVGHKVSCLSWNQYIKSQMASSDYEGIIKVWDVNTAQCTFQFTEHTKRAWSVDFCTANPNYLASGSDDATVKLWTTTSHRSVTTLPLGGNVCCVKFAPNNAHSLAVGTADHQVSCYDLRYPSSEYQVFSGHSKAVSYVRWLGDSHILSASTDSTLKRWDIGSATCEMTYRGHLNEKNFVGLSVNNDWISCGSEDNSLFAYHKDIHTPVATFKFPRLSDLMQGDCTVDESPSLFVSSTCWKRDSNTVIAANSRGVINVLRME